MPPKTKYSKQEIVNAAYAIACRQGIQAVVARKVALELNTTVSPIFTAFSNMDELKDEVFMLAKKDFIEYISSCLDYHPAFKQFGILYVEFASKQPNLYSLLMLGQRPLADTFEEINEEFKTIFEPIVANIMDTFKLNKKDSRSVLQQMLVHASGIASFTISGVQKLDEDIIGKSLSEACLGLVTIKKQINGDYDEQFMNKIIASINEKPKLIKENKDEKEII